MSEARDAAVAARKAERGETRACNPQTEFELGWDAAKAEPRCVTTVEQIARFWNEWMDDMAPIGMPRYRHVARAFLDRFGGAAITAVDREAITDALAHDVCQHGGHIPNRDRSLPGSCEFHRRTAGIHVDFVLTEVNRG